MKNFFRKVGFGIGPNDVVPNDPLQWHLTSLMKFQNFHGQEKFILKKELRKHYRDWVYNDRKVLRKKYKKIIKLCIKLKRSIKKRYRTKILGVPEISIRHNEAINSQHPVFSKLLDVLGNFLQ